MNENHIEAGRRGETLALEHLLGQGYRLVERNFRFQRGEIDLILAAPDGDLVFAEVKAGRGDTAGDPAAWVTAKKQRQLQRVAQGYCVTHGLADRPMRFDVLAVNLDESSQGSGRVRHFPHAFLPEAAVYFR